jgi:hypothetical protein
LPGKYFLPAARSAVGVSGPAFGRIVFTVERRPIRRRKIPDEVGIDARRSKRERMAFIGAGLEFDPATAMEEERGGAFPLAGGRVSGESDVSFGSVDGEVFGRSRMYRRRHGQGRNAPRTARRQIVVDGASRSD